MVLKEKDFESVMDSVLGGINGATSIFSLGANSNKQQNNQINNTINTYQNINSAIYDYVNSIKENFQTDINIETNKTKIPIDYSTQSQMMIFNKAKEAFSKIGKNVFNNNGENIYVSNSDIKESIAKTVRNANQKKLLSEHIEVFQYLDKIIENGQIIARGSETKSRSQYKNWDYYATPITIDGQNYIVEFDTVLRDNGQKHFRLERIYLLEEVTKNRLLRPARLKINQ